MKKNLALMALLSMPALSDVVSSAWGMEGKDDAYQQKKHTLQTGEEQNKKKSKIIRQLILDLNVLIYNPEGLPSPVKRKNFIAEISRDHNEILSIESIDALKKVYDTTSASGFKGTITGTLIPQLIKDLNRFREEEKKQESTDDSVYQDEKDGKLKKLQEAYDEFFVFGVEDTNKIYKEIPQFVDDFLQKYKHALDDKLKKSFESLKESAQKQIDAEPNNRKVNEFSSLQKALTYTLNLFEAFVEDLKM